jgi:hypothetical protein
MTARKHTKIIREGDLLAEVEVELLESTDPWAPYLSLDDAHKLDSVRIALKRGDVGAAARLARVFRLMPLTLSASN